MIEALLSFLVLVVIICVIAYVAIWAFQQFFPQALPPAKMIIGAFALIAILYALLRLVQHGIPGLS